MDALAAILALAAFVAGLTGTWSPCGFSMIETIGPRGHTGGRPTTIAACVTFAVGAVAGGVATFGLLASLGDVVHGAGGTIAYAIAVGIAIAAAIAEFRGAAIVPQLRRQLPEHWRRVMPMPVAAGLYGILLGLGFTTFVLTFGVFALAAIVFAVGEPATGVAVGIAFGIGRALPIVLTAPVADRPAGTRVMSLMAERPAIYRGFRVGDGIALLAASAALVVAVPAGASRTEVRPGADPATAAGSLVFERPDGTGVLRQGGHNTLLPGHDPALGEGRVAVLRAGHVLILSAKDLAQVGRVRAKDADAVAISGTWVAWRARIKGRDQIRARNIGDPAKPGPEHTVARAGGDAQLGRPSLDGNRLVYARASEAENLIVKRVLGAKHGHNTTLMRSTVEALSNPAIRGDDLLYVRITRRAQRLKLASLNGGGSGRTLLSRSSGTLWSTALSQKRAYVTLLQGSGPRARILSTGR